MKISQHNNLVVLRYRFETLEKEFFIQLSVRQQFSTFYFCLQVSMFSQSFIDNIVSANGEDMNNTLTEPIGKIVLRRIYPIWFVT